MIKKRTDLVQPIKPPTYRIGKFVLNEYELRQLQVRIMRGEVPNTITGIDYKGNHFSFREDGRIPEHIEGFDISGNYTLDMIRDSREKRKVAEERHVG